VSYAKGKKAFGFCDRCGFRYPFAKLKYQYIDEANSHLKVCPSCMDIDHEQLQVGKQEYDDPKPLQDPRPDSAEDDSRRLYGFDPVGSVGLWMRMSLGNVTVSNS
jgi:hypothetical protein